MAGMEVGRGEVTVEWAIELSLELGGSSSAGGGGERL